MLLIHCEINLILTQFDRGFITNNTVVSQEPTFTITNTKIYVPAVTFSTQDNTKLLKQLKLGFKRTINWNKHHSKVTVEKQNRYLIC